MSSSTMQVYLQSECNDDNDEDEGDEDEGDDESDNNNASGDDVKHCHKKNIYNLIYM